MDPAQPGGAAVAVRDGRVLGVGPVDELAGWGEHHVDERFSDKVLMPGFVEAHCHAWAGEFFTFLYVGSVARSDAAGRVWPPCRDIAEVLARIREHDHDMTVSGAAPDAVLIAWGFDPLHLGGERLVAADLDRVSRTRPIYVDHLSGHLATVNTALMHAEGTTAAATTPGVVLGADGHPDGELRELPAIELATEARRVRRAAFATEEGLWDFARLGRNVGHTFLVDLGSGPLEAERLDHFRRATADPAFPARLMWATSLGTGDAADLAARTAELIGEATDTLRFGVVKLWFDGSLPEANARLGAPGYYRPPPAHGDQVNRDNGHWLTAPEQLEDIVATFHRAGLSVHVHCNGDEAIGAFLDVIEAVLERHPRWDHRHTVQHCQMATAEQFRRMKRLGVGANLFTNHVFHRGDLYRDVTLGHERARSMNACATAEREGVPFSIHSDAGVTPLGHLHTAWCAVNRLTMSGDVLGAHERVSVDRALHAITLGAAHQVKMDHLIGSIEPGKFADFAVLDEDPLEVDPSLLADIGVWGTVLGGVPHEAP